MVVAVGPATTGVRRWVRAGRRLDHMRAIPRPARTAGPRPQAHDRRPTTAGPRPQAHDNSRQPPGIVRTAAAAEINACSNGRRPRRSPMRPARTSSSTPRAGHLRRQGQEPAQPAVELLRAAGTAARAHPPDGARPPTTVEWIVANEVEAFFLEFNLIKRHKPRFNIRLKDDKSYPYLAVTLDEEWPRAMVMRGEKRKGVRYFGPFAHAYAIRETLDLLLRTFPIRTCTQLQVRPAPPARPAVPLRAHREVRGAVRRRHRSTTSTWQLVAGAARLPRRRARRR